MKNDILRNAPRLRSGQAECGVPFGNELRAVWRNAGNGALSTGHTAFKRSMTLIELLVVIAIISIIISAIVVASLTALKHAQVRGTRGVMQRIASGLAQYKQQYGMYVPAPLSDGNSREYSTYPLWQALEHDGSFSGVPAANKLAGTADPQEASVSRYIYIDAWKKPLWYQCPPLKYDTNATPPEWVPEIGDFNRFRIISSGPDLEMGAPTDTDSVWGDNIIVE